MTREIFHSRLVNDNFPTNFKRNTFLANFKVENDFKSKALSLKLFMKILTDFKVLYTCAIFHALHAYSMHMLYSRLENDFLQCSYSQR